MNNTEGKKKSIEIRGGTTLTYTSKPLPKPAPQNPRPQSSEKSK